MTDLHRLQHHPRMNKRRKIVGRGPGSGHGKTSGRGHKGQKARGPGARPGFEGGQMPLIRTLPKRGFTFRSKERFQVVNVGGLKNAEKGTLVNPDWLWQKDLIASRKKRVKILGDGALEKALTVQAHAFSEEARSKIEKAGGKCEILK